MNHREIAIDGEHSTLRDFENIVHGQASVCLAPTAREKMNRSRAMVESLLQDQKTVYGVTTGFGKFSDTIIDPSQTSVLQKNLIRSHACGIGKPLEDETVRGMMLLRANALAKGYSGVRTSVVTMLLHFLNLGIHPVIPSQGSLGAGGDLAPLAHMILPLLGEGEVRWQGKLLSGKQALQQAGLAPLSLQAKEGLALINGTQMMASLGARSVLDADRLILAA